MAEVRTEITIKAPGKPDLTVFASATKDGYGDILILEIPDQDPLPIILRAQPKGAKLLTEKFQDTGRLLDFISVLFAVPRPREF